MDKEGFSFKVRLIDNAFDEEETKEKMPGREASRQDDSGSMWESYDTDNVSN